MAMATTSGCAYISRDLVTSSLCDLSQPSMRHQQQNPHIVQDSTTSPTDDVVIVVEDDPPEYFDPPSLSQAVLQQQRNPGIANVSENTQTSTETMPSSADTSSMPSELVMKNAILSVVRFAHKQLPLISEARRDSSDRGKGKHTQRGDQPKRKYPRRSYCTKLLTDLSHGSSSSITANADDETGDVSMASAVRKNHRCEKIVTDSISEFITSKLTLTVALKKRQPELSTTAAASDNLFAAVADAGTGSGLVATTAKDNDFNNMTQNIRQILRLQQAPPDTDDDVIYVGTEYEVDSPDVIYTTAKTSSNAKPINEHSSESSAGNTRVKKKRTRKTKTKKIKKICQNTRENQATLCDPNTLLPSWQGTVGFEEIEQDPVRMLSDIKKILDQTTLAPIGHGRLLRKIAAKNAKIVSERNRDLDKENSRRANDDYLSDSLNRPKYRKTEKTRQAAVNPLRTKRKYVKKSFNSKKSSASSNGRISSSKAGRLSGNNADSAQDSIQDHDTSGWDTTTSIAAVPAIGWRCFWCRELYTDFCQYSRHMQRHRDDGSLREPEEAETDAAKMLKKGKKSYVTSTIVLKGPTKSKPRKKSAAVKETKKGVSEKPTSGSGQQQQRQRATSGSARRNNKRKLAIPTDDSDSDLDPWE